jgi:glycosyltransferase involved in cell wall biosynthesis
MSHGTPSAATEPATCRPIGLEQLRAADKRTFPSRPQPSANCSVALLTGGDDKPYVLGLTEALTLEGMSIDCVGSDDLDVPELRNMPGVRFLNLRGNQRPEASLTSKALRIVRYYLRLVHYTATAQSKIFHILWNNKFELLDRTLLLLYYKMCGKTIAFTAHNVNVRRRNGNDSWLNRISLKMQYRLCDHIFVHTEKMRYELVSDFDVVGAKISVIPFGINNTLPNTRLTDDEARNQLGIGAGDKTLLFFGQIAPYKGLEYLVKAFEELAGKSRDYRLVIAGKPKSGYQVYWDQIQARIAGKGLAERVLQRIQHIPDEKVELYFKAADAVILPYTEVFQSGVLFLGYSFGLPAIAADVGSLREEVIEGETGFVFNAHNSSDLAEKIERYFVSDLFRNLESRRSQIKVYANERYSWDKVAKITTAVYSDLLAKR